MPFKRSRMQALREAKERDVISEPTQAEIADLQKSWFETDDLTTLLASTGNGEGAALIGIEDSGALIAATTVEGALAEIATDVAAIGVIILDNATSITVFAGGASSLTELKPLWVPIGAKSVSGAWKVTTGANVSVIAVGAFT